MSKPIRYGVTFSLDNVEHSRNCVEIVYWIEAHQVVGEAYFTQDDFCAPITNGEFTHPYSGRRFKLYAPSAFFSAAHNKCLLDELRWIPVGRSAPVQATPF